MNKYCFTTYDFVIDFLLPNRCPSCGEFIPWNKCVCRACYGEFTANKSHEPPQFTEAMFVPFEYSGKVKSAILSMKTDGNKNIARITADLIKPYVLNTGFDLITAVPMEHKHRMQRGFNQAEFLAEFLSKLTAVPADYRILKHERTQAQHELDAKTRIKNAELTYSVLKNKDLSGKRILLCDDIITTGATISACAKLLKSLGAEYVACCAAAKTVKYI